MDYCITKYGWRKSYKKSRFKKSRQRKYERVIRQMPQGYVTYA